MKLGLGVNIKVLDKVKCPTVNYGIVLTSTSCILVGFAGALVIQLTEDTSTGTQVDPAIITDGIFKGGQATNGGIEVPSNDDRSLLLHLCII